MGCFEFESLQSNMIGMSMIGLNDNVESNHSELTYIPFANRAFIKRK